MNIKNGIFHPFMVIGASFAAALSFALLVTLRFEGDTRYFYLYYFLPVGIPFVAYLFDRYAIWMGRNWVCKGIDVIVMALSLARAVIAIPLISGHALFLTYAILSARTWVTRTLALIVMFQVAYLKLFIWHDTTFWGGIIFGAIAGLCFQYAYKLTIRVRTK